jgi:hypothetical protein
VTLTTTVVVGSAATPAQAAFHYCADSGTFPSVRCTVPYQAYPYGQTTGLRSSMMGYPDLGITAMQEANADEIVIRLKVWDLNSDGYRARVWADVYNGCWCVDSAYHVGTLRNGEGGNQGASAVFDSTTSAGTVSGLTYVNPNGTANPYYVVRLRLGRFQLSTGRYEWGEEQRYHLYVYRL